PLLMSMLRAKEYLLTSARIPAQKAVEIGLANRVTPDGDTLDEAIALAEKIAQQPPHAVQTTQRALNIHLTRAVTGVLEYALSEEYASFDTTEHREVVTAFLERSRSRAAASS